MQLYALAHSAAPRTTPQVLASQTIDITARALPGGAVAMHTTEREFRLAGARDGIDTFASIHDAVEAARALSTGSMPGLAILRWRGGYRLHDVHTSSRTWSSVSPHHPTMPPSTTLTRRSSVPFAAGNLRLGDLAGKHNPAVVRDASLVALIDGARTFVAGTDAWSGKPRLIETNSI